jgi:hypothetical protein
MQTNRPEVHGIFTMTLAQLESAAAKAFDAGATSTLLRIAERKAELLARAKPESIAA